MTQGPRNCNKPRPASRAGLAALLARVVGRRKPLSRPANAAAPDPPMPASRADLFAMLDRLGIKTATTEHPPLHTVEESQALRGEIAGGHTKNLFLKDKKDQVFLVVAEEDAAIDMKSLHKRIGSARLSFGKPELLIELLGVVPGSVTPFGVINDHRRARQRHPRHGAASPRRS